MQSEPVSVLGLGLMGATLARTFVTAGHDVTVWNRSPGRAQPFTGTAKVAGSAAEACAASPLVVVCLADQTACREVLETPAVEDNRRRAQPGSDARTRPGS